MVLSIIELLKKIFLIIKLKLEYLMDEFKNFFVIYMVILWCIRNIIILISVYVNLLFWYVYIKYE